MEKKTIMLEKEGYPLEIVTKRVTSYKPIRNSEGSILYKDALKYLFRVLPPDDPSLDIILGLASFATANNLSDKQAKLADKFIDYWEKEGFYNAIKKRTIICPWYFYL